MSIAETCTEQQLHCVELVALDRWRAVHPVPVSRLGSCMVSLQRADRLDDLGGSGHAVVCRVELRDEGSSTLLRVCSLVQVVNQTEPCNRL